MARLLKFEHVVIEALGRISLEVATGEVRVLQVPSAEAQLQVIELIVGEQLPVQGSVLLQGVPVVAAQPGSVGWVPAAGGLISNLKAWENVTLPLWYHGKRRQLSETEAAIAVLLGELGMPQAEWERFMASPAARLSPPERKLAGLMRGLLLEPDLLVVDAGLFDEVESNKVQLWIAALEKFVRAAEPRAVLAVAHAPSPLPWTRLE
ncbi:MAG TPA: ATP-binding cassette domain-containing protein [Gallionellaceae bacterium]